MQLQLIFSTNVTLLKVGGAIIGKSTEIAEKLYKSKQLPGPPRYVVVISTHLKRNLTEDEVNAIYYHELGHFVLGHLFGHRSLLSPRSKELEADKFSAKKVGADVMLSALQKVPSIISKCRALRNSSTTDRTDTEYEEAMHKLITRKENEMQFRYNALKRMMLII